MAVSSQQQSHDPEGGLLALALGISAAVTRGGELGAMLRSCAEELADHVRLITRVHIWVRSGDSLELSASSDPLQPAAGINTRIRLGELTIGRIAESGEPYLTSNVAEEFETADPSTVLPSVTAFAGYPLLVEGRAIGVLALFAQAPIRPRVQAVLEPVAAIIAQAIARKQFENDLRAAVRLHGDVENRLAVIADASGALLEPLQPEQVLERIVGLARKVLAADAYAVWRGDAQGEWRILLATGLSDHYQTRGFTGPSRFSGGLPDEPVIAEDVDALPLVEHRREMYHAEGIRSFIAFPLRIHGRNEATLTLYFRTAQNFHPEQVRVGLAVANLAAAAIASAEAFDDQRRMREQAQEQTRRIAFIAEASKLLATTLDFEHTLRAVASLAIPAFADWCTVDILGEDGEIRRLATVHADPARLALAEEYHRRFPPLRDDVRGVAGAIRNRQPVLVSEIPDELLLQNVQDEDQIRFLRDLKLKSVIIAPMAARERVLGAITFVTAESGRRYGPDDLAAAEHVARRAGLAIDNALLFRAAEERHAEANRALEALAASHDRLQQFAYAASHDLREPLRTITAYLQLIEQRLGPALPAEARENFAFVTGAAGRIRQLLDDLLDYVRLGDSAAQRVRFPLAAAAARALENLGITVNEAGADVSIGDLPTIVGDEPQFVRLFQNLISNAIKYRSRDQPLVRIRGERRGGLWAIAVQDNGVGIAREHQQRIFGVFKRLHGQDVPGTGIGLAIARAVVENHGGKIWVESEPGNGATFWFTVPAAPDA